MKRRRLSSVNPGESVTIVQCANENAELLAYLDELGLLPGVTVGLITQAPFNGPLTLRLEQNERVVGVEIARTLLVE